MSGVFFMVKYFVKDLQEEHKHITKELNIFNSEIDSTDNLPDVLEMLKRFLRKNLAYINRHLKKEKAFYKHLDKQLGNKVVLEELTASNELIMEEIDRLRGIGEDSNIVEVKGFIKEFTDDMKDRMSIEEETLFKIADYALEEGMFE